MQLNVSTRREAGLGIVEAKGEIDMATAGIVRQAITDLIADGCVDLVLDLGPLTFIDSTGLGVIVGARKKAEHLGGSFVVVCTHPRILRLLDITGLSQAMPVHATVAAAVAARNVPCNTEGDAD